MTDGAQTEPITPTVEIDPTMFDEARQLMDEHPVEYCRYDEYIVLQRLGVRSRVGEWQPASGRGSSPTCTQETIHG